MSEHYENEKTYSPAEIAEKRGVHRITVYRWIKRGLLKPAPRLGRKIAIPASQVDGNPELEG